MIIQPEIITEITDLTTIITTADDTLKELTNKRDRLIREALEGGVSRKSIAEAAQVKVARLYQIRDRRR